MIEQYLCANSDSAGIGENGLPLNAGFGCVAKTQNLSDGDVSRLDAFAGLFPISAYRRTDALSQNLPSAKAEALP